MHTPSSSAQTSGLDFRMLQPSGIVTPQSPWSFRTSIPRGPFGLPSPGPPDFRLPDLDLHLRFLTQLLDPSNEPRTSCLLSQHSLLSSLRPPPSPDLTMGHHVGSLSTPPLWTSGTCGHPALWMWPTAA
ncbi:hypothetical protein K438DRAFT_1988234 [Mycena galopus ATCC 62051]|nr:hypothetical protein K438DRAFT_1988234 [Mycena galopus ATCC 62051]